MRGGWKGGGRGRPKGSKNQKTEAQEQKRPPIRNLFDLPAADLLKQEDLSPLDFMLRVMWDPTQDPGRRDRMAVSAAAYMHSRVAGTSIGKGDMKLEKAKKAASGKFAAPPQTQFDSFDSTGSSPTPSRTLYRGPLQRT